MKINVNILCALALVLIIVPVVSIGFDDTTDEKLKTDVTVDSDNFTASKAIAVAVEKHKPEILLAAMNNRSFDVWSEAVVAMTKLPENQATKTLVVLLSMDRLWSKRVKSGEMQISQDYFNAAVKNAIAKVFKVDTANVDLFNGSERQNLLAAMKKAMP